MKFLSLSAKNFMSFRELEFIFPLSGLVFVGGEVVDGAISSSNGAGKSSIFEALCFGLYGQTIRNAGKDAIVNRYAGQGCVVEVIFEDDHGEVFMVRRYRNDAKFMNSLFFYKADREITGAESRVTQGLIDQVLKMNWMVFSTAVIFGEKAQRFAEARDSEKKQIFDEILMLQQYQDALVQVRNDLKSLKSESDQHGTERGLILERLAGTQRQIDGLVHEFDELKKRMDSADLELATMEYSHQEFLKELERVSEEVKQAKDSYDSLDKENQTLYTQIQNLEKEKAEALKDVNRELMAAQVDKATCERVMRDLTSKRDSVKSSRAGGPCPTCGQDITEQSIQAVRDHYIEELKKLEEQHNVKQIQVSGLTTQSTAITAQYALKSAAIFKTKTEMDSTLKELQKVYVNKQLEEKKVEAEIQLLVVKINTLITANKDALAKLEKQKAEIQSRWDTDQVKLAEIDKRIADMALTIAYLKFWEDGFGNTGIKSLLLDEIIPQLNDRVAFYANVLMDEEIRVQFDTESLLKKGDMKDKFDVGIYRGDDKVEYASLSSGEKRRADVAILLALQSLVFERGASSSNLIVLDEVFDSLDTVGVERVIGLLAEEAKEKVIFVISHMAEFRDYFESEVIVKKKGDQSYLSGGQE